MKNVLWKIILLTKTFVKTVKTKDKQKILKIRLHLAVYNVEKGFQTKFKY